jgi:hypothetical protein
VDSELHLTPSESNISCGVDFAETRLPSFWSLSTGDVHYVCEGRYVNGRESVRMEVLKQKWTVIDLVRYLWQWDGS